MNINLKHIGEFRIQFYNGDNASQWTYEFKLSLSQAKGRVKEINKLMPYMRASIFEITKTGGLLQRA